MTSPTVKSIGGVMSYITELPSVVELTTTPSFPAESEKDISKVIIPSGSVIVIS